MSLYLVLNVSGSMPIKTYLRWQYFAKYLVKRSILKRYCIYKLKMDISMQCCMNTVCRQHFKELSNVQHTDIVFDFRTIWFRIYLF